jgi:hypothetical protein
MTTARPSRGSIALLILLLLLAGGLRVYLAWKAHEPTLDTAVVGQMALDILQGDRPAFFAGQNYMGALEAYLVALVFKVVPPGRVTMTFATIGFALAWIAATFFFFRRRHGDWAALAAASIPAFPGWQTAWYTTVPYGGYPETYFFGTILLLLALPFLDRRDFVPSGRHAFALAAVAGLAMWTNLQVVPFLAAAGLAGLWALGRQPRPLRRWLPYGLVPAAVVLAFLPQWLAEPSHVQPPLFAELSLEAAARSWRLFRQHDLRLSVMWTYPPAVLHVGAASLMAILVAGSAMLAFRFKRDEPGRAATTWLVLLMVAAFSLTYFPHPMSGFVPRYLNAPVALVLSWSLALWASANSAWVRRVGFAAAFFLAAYNATGLLRAAQNKEADARQTRENFAEAIQAARAGGWPAILDTGSEVEGYDGARLTLMSLGQPTFASAFSDRFLDHQLAWEFSERAGYLTRRGHLPFVEGSLDALNVSMRGARATSRFVLFDVPEVARPQERSCVPESIADWSGPVARHPLFDPSAATTWPETPDFQTHALTLRFRDPIRFAGLRVAATGFQELPYRYVVRVQQPDGTWITAQQSERRIAGSYLSGTRVYFRGHHPWMDLRFEPVLGTALEWIVLPGPDNPVPPRLYDLHVLAVSGEPWPEWSPIAAGLQAILEANPAATLIAERGVLRALHLQIRSAAVLARIPLPYNPRFARTQPERFSLVAGTYLIVIEEAYREYTLAVLETCGGDVLSDQPVPPFRVLTVSIDAAASGKAAWHGFQLIGIDRPSP